MNILSPSVPSCPVVFRRRRRPLSARPSRRPSHRPRHLSVRPVASRRRRRRPLSFCPSHRRRPSSVRPSETTTEPTGCNGLEFKLKLF